MKDLIFKTSRTMEEIDEEFNNIDIFAALTESLQEALMYSKGCPVPGTVVRKRSLPDIDASKSPHIAAQQ